VARINRSNLTRTIASLAVCSMILSAAAIASAAARGVSSREKTITLELPHAFNPIPPKGGHDLYHCALLNPNLKINEMITSTTFTPGTKFEVHHAVLYWVPPSEAAAATKLNDGGKGWTCFGGPGIGGSGTIADLGSSSWLSGWAPGHGTDTEPTGTGMPLPVGSLIVMQIHYNLLAGHRPDRSKVELKMVPAAGSNLLPLKIDLYPAPIDLPCPAGEHGKLCSRAASLRDIGQRFGKSAIAFDNLLEEVCSGGVPVVSDTSTCTWTIPNGGTAYIWRITPHMHLLGVSFTFTLNPGTAQQRTLLTVPSYNFHYQRGYDMASPVKVVPGDRLQVSCTFNPVLRSELPYLKDLPPRFVLWADGSSDEMCLSIVSVTSSLTLKGSGAGSEEGPGVPQWPPALTAAAAREEHSTRALATSEIAISQELGDADGFLGRLGLCGVTY
jgi:Copper type II ascorbate-dependent monooxygenase, C-terminal domain